MRGTVFSDEAHGMHAGVALLVLPVSEATGELETRGHSSWIWIQATWKGRALPPACALWSLRQKVESPGLSKRRFCAFDWPKRRSACLGLSSFWRNDHTTCTIVTQLFLSTPSITFRDYLIPSHHPIPPLQMHKYFVPVLCAAITARTRLKSCVYYTAKEDQMMLSCQRWHLRSSSAPIRVHPCSLKVKEAALRFFLSSKCIPDAGKHSKTSTIRGNQLMIKRTRDAAGRIDTRHARRQLFDVCIRHRRPLTSAQQTAGPWFLEPSGACAGDAPARFTPSR